MKMIPEWSPLSFADVNWNTTNQLVKFLARFPNRWGIFTRSVRPYSRYQLSCNSSGRQISLKFCSNSHINTFDRANESSQIIRLHISKSKMHYLSSHRATQYKPWARNNTLSITGTLLDARFLSVFELNTITAITFLNTSTLTMTFQISVLCCLPSGCSLLTP